ncbi:MAG: cbb3-type cytochrome c oxidase subunit 3 [bacterium]|nr:cbb3-type cytochrome c oxidase subunit 3 [bacterium]
MLSQMLKSVTGLEFYPTVSLVLFFAAFVFTVVKVIRLDRGYLKYMKEMPLDSNDETANSGRFTE